MDIPRQLIADLSQLSDALDVDGTDLQAMVDVLIDDLATAVPSFAGFSMTIAVDGHSEGVTLNFLDPDVADEVRASMRMPLDALGIGAGGSVIFYAARPGAFVDLAADTRFAYGLDGQVVLDRHLPSVIPGETTPVIGHTAASTINQAIGVLLDRGHTGDEARQSLQQRAAQQGLSLQVAAQQVLDHPDR